MSAINQSLVSMRIWGDEVIPQDISKMLGVSPSEAKTKGHEIVRGNTGRVIVDPKTGKARVAKFGLWLLRAERREPEDIDSQIREIFSKMSADIAVWQSITKKHRANLSCGLFMRETNEGLSISTESLAILSERGIELWFDIYAPSDDDDETST
jgi:Domain of unknown function (DUF4279)